MTALVLAPEVSGAERGRPPVVVDAVPVAVETVSDTVHAVGSLLADQAIVVRPEVAGRVVEIGFKDGTPVKKGQVLFTLDAGIYAAELKQAEATLKLSQQNLERATELFQRRSGTARARDEAVAQHQTAQAAVELARARLDKMVIRAPYSGIAGISKVDTGAYVIAGQDLVSLDDIDPIKVDFEIPERHIGQVRTGQATRLAVDALPDRTFEGTVFAISPRLDATGRSAEVLAAVPNPDGALRPGMFARVTLLVATRPNAILIPEQALVPRADGFRVFKVVDGVAHELPVTVGLRSNGRAEIVDGLAPGDVVVTAGQPKLSDGAPVTLRRPAQG